MVSDGDVLSYPNTTWQNTVPPVQPKGLASGSAPSQNMWRWQSLQEYQYPLLEYLRTYLNKPLFIGIESVVAGHEHSSMSVITGQMPASLSKAHLPNRPGYTAVGDATALSKWEYCFDRADTDTSRGNTTVGGTVGNNWDCSVAGSLNSADPSWNATAQKLIPAGGAGTGTRGDMKTLERIYAKHLKTPQAKEEIDELSSLVLKAGPVCLLCYERDHAHCHRKWVAEIIEDRDGVKVENLLPSQL